MGVLGQAQFQASSNSAPEADRARFTVFRLVHGATENAALPANLLPPRALNTGRDRRTASQLHWTGQNASSRREKSTDPHRRLYCAHWHRYYVIQPFTGFYILDRLAYRELLTAYLSAPIPRHLSLASLSHHRNFLPGTRASQFAGCYSAIYFRPTTDGLLQFIRGPAKSAMGTESFENHMGQ